MQLHQDIDWQAALRSIPRRVTNAASWIRDGIVQSLPARLHWLAGQQGPTDIGILPTLDDTKVFWTTLSVPKGMGGRLEEVANLQLSQLSPLPSADVAMAIGPAYLADNGRVTADIAIVRQTDLQNLNDLHARESTTTVRSIKADGTEAIFGKQQDGKQALKKVLSSKGFMAAVILLAFAVSISIYSSRVETKYSAIRVSLAPKVKQAALLRTDIDELTSKASVYSSERLLRPLAELQPTDGQVIVERLTLSQGRIQLSGWSHTDADMTALTAHAPLSLRQDPREDWQRFSISWMMERDG